MRNRLSITMFLLPAIVLAAVLIPEASQAGSLTRICTATGNCGVCDIVATFITIGKWLMTGAAGLALLVITNASIATITSAGNAEKIGAAKKQIMWSVLGTLLTYFAFNLVGMVILFMVTPSNLLAFNADKNERGAHASLSAFLLGTPWFNICDEQALRENGKNNAPPASNATATCKFWGDGTPCSPVAGDSGAPTNPAAPVSICYQGSCVSPEANNELIANIGLGKADKDARPVKNPSTNENVVFNNACEYLSKVDPLYKGYECKQKNTCGQQSIIEQGFCPGTKDYVCCSSASAGGAGGAGGGGVSDAGYPWTAEEENLTRTALNVSIGYDAVNKPACGAKDYHDVIGGCTNIAGLSADTLATLANIKSALDSANCSYCLIITGGTEKGHGSHGFKNGSWQQRLDLRHYGTNSKTGKMITALENAGLTFSTSSFTGANTFVCEEQATGNGLSKPACLAANSAHFHVSLNN